MRGLSGGRDLRDNLVELVKVREPERGDLLLEWQILCGAVSGKSVDVYFSLLVRRPDSNFKVNQLNYKLLIVNALMIYTQLYTQLFSFKN